MKDVIGVNEAAPLHRHSQPGVRVKRAAEHWYGCAEHHWLVRQRPEIDERHAGFGPIDRVLKPARVAGRAIAVVIGADGVGRGEYVRLVHRTFPGLAAARNTKLLHESQGLLTRGGRRRVAGDPGVTQQGGRAIGARSQDRVAGPTQLCLLSVSRLVNPAPLRPLSLYEILDLALHAGQRLRQITVTNR